MLFADLNDGSTMANMQLVLDRKYDNLCTGASVSVTGNIALRNGRVDLAVSKLDVLGGCPPDYPLFKGRLPMDHLRSNLHLRSRTATFGAVWRLRSTLFAAVQSFFKDQSFLQVSTPVLTGNDCEGGGEAFRVTNGKDDEFFGHPVYTAVSGQLHAEFLASAMSRVYTLGPTFRAERSDSTRHLAEFWMLEAEMAFFTDLDQLLDFVEALMVQVAKHILLNAREEIQFFDERFEKGLIDKLTACAEGGFTRITYTEAVKILAESSLEIERTVNWGESLSVQHERFLADKFGPVFITDYPKAVKPFYMKSSLTCKEGFPTVACMDFILPLIGEVVGGSIREDNYDQLAANIIENKQRLEDFDWYLDLRKYGSVPHGGFGLGMERILAYCTGIRNVRDLIPAPRYMDHCKM